MIENIDASASPNKGKGRAHQWLVDHLDYPHDYCLIWPFSLTRGYGALSHLGRRGYAHRFMCELAKGDPSTPGHEAAHSCGRGDEGCVNPRHLSWKTKTQNALDCRQHGTQAKSCYGNRGKLTEEQTAQIRALRPTMLGSELASLFGVHETTISNIVTGRTRNRKPKINYWTDDEADALRRELATGKSISKIAAAMGKTYGSIRAKAGRLRPLPDPGCVTPAERQNPADGTEA